MTRKFDYLFYNFVPDNFDYSEKKLTPKIDYFHSKFDCCHKKFDYLSNLILANLTTILSLDSSHRLPPNSIPAPAARSAKSTGRVPIAGVLAWYHVHMVTPSPRFIGGMS